MTETSEQQDTVDATQSDEHSISPYVAAGAAGAVMFAAAPVLIPAAVGATIGMGAVAVLKAMRVPVDDITSKAGTQFKKSARTGKSTVSRARNTGSRLAGSVKRSAQNVQQSVEEGIYADGTAQGPDSLSSRQ